MPADGRLFKGRIGARPTNLLNMDRCDPLAEFWAGPVWETIGEDCVETYSPVLFAFGLS